jgi:hypothetical protein
MADRKAEREERRAETKAIQPRTKAIRDKSDAHHEKTETGLKLWKTENKTDLEQTVVTNLEVNPGKLEPNPEKMESGTEYREVPKEEAAVKSSGTMKKRHKGRHLAAGRRGEQKKLIRGDCGSRRKLAAPCRKVSHRAAVTRRKKYVFRKIRTQGKYGTQTELAAACRKMTRCAEVARHR